MNNTVNDRISKKTLVGIVTSSGKMDKTAIVTVENLVKHPIYKKYIRRRKNFMSHDEKNESKIGNVVLICQCRPLSKNKRWRINKIMKKSDTTKQ